MESMLISPLTFEETHIQNTQTKFLIQCDNCGRNWERSKVSICRGREKHQGKDICRNCIAKSSISQKPQCTKEFWKDPKIKEKHSVAISTSEKYKIAIENRDTFGHKNSMYGKQHTQEARAKMTQSRIGKTGEKATAWKGGKRSLLAQVKGIQHSRYNWYKRVYIRDEFQCIQCASKNRIEAHHKKPMKILVKELLERKPAELITEHSIIEWLAIQPEIVDENLENGITLCRTCHKKEHGNDWGSKF